MQPTILLVCEKPSVTRHVLPAVERANVWPGHKVLALETLYPLGRFSFDYRRGLAFHDLPTVIEPCWRPREGMPWTRHVDAYGQVASYPDVSPDDAVKGASQIVFACDPDVRGAMAFHVLLAETLGAPAADLPRPAIWLTSLNEASIETAIGAMGSTDEAAFRNLVKAGHARRFFDYNFNINAMMLFSVAFRACGLIGHGPFAVSKFGLQLLYFLRDQQLGEGALIAQMSQWPGTGRYLPASLGSPSSYAAIIDQLRDAHLVEKRDGTQAVRLTETGRAFLDRLHPDCKDADLPQRLRLWETEWPASRPAMDRYLRTFFGKQRRFG